MFNARIGIHGPDQRWAVELWAQNLFNKNYQAGRVRRVRAGLGHAARASSRGFYTRSNQLFGAFLAEPRTFGMTLRGKFGPSRARRAGICRAAGPAAAAAGTQTCADGTVIEATAPARCRRRRRLRRRPKASAAKRSDSS